MDVRSSDSGYFKKNWKIVQIYVEYGTNQTLRQSNIQNREFQESDVYGKGCSWQGLFNYLQKKEGRPRISKFHCWFV